MKADCQRSFANYLYLQRVAPKTHESYLYYIKNLSAYYKQPADQLTNDQVQDYLLYCIQERKLAWSTCNVLFCGLKKYYHDFLGYDDARFFHSSTTPINKTPNAVKQGRGWPHTSSTGKYEAPGAVDNCLWFRASGQRSRQAASRTYRVKAHAGPG